MLLILIIVIYIKVDYCHSTRPTCSKIIWVPTTADNGNWWPSGKAPVEETGLESNYRPQFKKTWEMLFSWKIH